MRFLKCLFTRTLDPSEYYRLGEFYLSFGKIANQSEGYLGSLYVRLGLERTLVAPSSLDFQRMGILPKSNELRFKYRGVEVLQLVYLPFPVFDMYGLGDGDLPRQLRGDKYPLHEYLFKKKMLTYQGDVYFSTLHYIS